MKLVNLLRRLFCAHSDQLRKSTDDGLMYLECMHCGHCTPGIPVGPFWHLVKEGE
jgi:heterodisulfide reductase subunit C